MTNDLSAGLLVVLAVLAGLAGLLVAVDRARSDERATEAPSHLAVDRKGGATGTGGAG